ncbi:HNH endonuclease signature motif containing protein [Paenibacillus sp. FSL L8-0494]|uniref:HNH endonuclease signature motif containing protein n=1 Tax=Paenibacillus sp. FSL L8-0494 TaxID=2975352 RepID=UPI0030FAB514
MKKKKIEFKTDENGCFVITSHRINGDGYSYFYRNSRHQRVHRFIYEECYGEIPDELVVRHKCDNPSCINPEHLELGTKSENSHDSIDRGRNAFGEKNGMSKITNKEAGMIKKMLSIGMSTNDIAHKMNVTYHIVYKIKIGQTWTHVNISA